MTHDLQKYGGWQKLKEGDEFQTGDLLLFHHNWTMRDGWMEGALSVFTRLIEWFTHSPYDHAAIVVKDPQFTETPMKGLYILESSYEPFGDVEDHKKKVGVELEEFDKVIQTWPGPVYWRKLDCDRNEAFNEKLAEAHQVVHDKPYDTLPTDWFRAEYEIKSKEDQRTDRFFCSALVSYIYTKLGLLPSDTPWSLISPDQLSTDSVTETKRTKVDLINGKLEKQIQIK